MLKEIFQALRGKDVLVEMIGQVGQMLDIGQWMFDKASGTDQVRKDFVAGLTAEEIVANWESNLKPFLPIRQKYLLY